MPAVVGSIIFSAIGLDRENQRNKGIFEFSNTTILYDEWINW